jgi:hypothetical protein
MNEAGFNSTAFLSWARRDGKVECDYGRATKVKRIPGLSSPARCVCIVNPTMLEEVTNEF